MIENLLIRDFRGIRTGRIAGFKKINVFVGPNNSGKSALIEALYLAGAVGRPAGLTIHGGDEISEPEIYAARVAQPDLLNSHPMARVRARHNDMEKKSKSGRWLEGIFQIEPPDPNLPFAGFDLTAGEGGFDRDEIEDIALFAVDGKENPGDISKLADKLMGDRDISALKDKRMVFCWDPGLSYYYRGSACWLIQGEIASARKTLFFDPSSIQTHMTRDFYGRMLKLIPGWSQQLARYFKPILGLEEPLNLHFFPVETGGGQWVQAWIAPEDRPAIPIDAFGDGARSAFKLIAPLVAVSHMAGSGSPGLLLWEEPESFQNPRTLARLLAQVLNLIKDKPVQIFMATHSLEVVAHLTALLNSGRLSDDELLLFRLDLKDGELLSSWFDADNLRAWLESGLDPRIWGDFRLPLQFYLQKEAL